MIGAPPSLDSVYLWTGPLGTFFVILLLVGWIFSFFMLLDCMRRPPDFNFRLTKSGEYDKILWALFIAFTFSYFLGAVSYWFLIYRPEFGNFLPRGWPFPPRTKDEGPSAPPSDTLP